MLSGIRHIQLPVERPYVDSNWHLFPIRVNSDKRTEIFDGMRKNGIGVQVNYLPAYRHPVFQKNNFEVESFPNSEVFYSQAISLPMFPQLTTENLISISKALQDVI